MPRLLHHISARYHRASGRPQKRARIARSGPAGGSEHNRGVRSKKGPAPRYSTRGKTMVRSDMLPQPDRGLGLDRPQTEAFHRRVQEEDSRSPQRRKAQARGHGRVRPRQEHRGEAGQVDKRDRLAARRRQPHARVEPDPGARAREPQAPDGGRRLKTSGASIRSEVRAMAANGGAAAPYRRSAGIEAF